jgi:hypothetical protein
MGYVSPEHDNLMLNDKKATLRALDSIRQLYGKPRCSRTSNVMVPEPQSLSSSQQDAHQTPAPVKSTPRGRSRKKKSDAKSEDLVNIVIKVWLEARSSILLQNVAYNGISQENFVQISWFPPTLMARAKPFSL